MKKQFIVIKMNYLKRERLIKGKTVKIRSWEEFKRLIIKHKPRSITFNVEKNIPARNLTSLRLILPIEKTQYVFIDTPNKYRLRKTGIPLKFDKEGRTLITEFPSFILFNIYFPNGKQSQGRLDFKLDFYDTFLAYADNLKVKGKNIIVCGDFNTAHREIDLARPKENEKISGFLPIERAWIDTFIDHGYIDTFRHFYKEPDQYTWWDMKSRARERNVGWRIDYFFVNNEYLSNLKNAFIMQDVMGSDHCPIGIEIKV